MKKLMMALAAVAVAAGVQAAQIKWSAANVYAGNSTDKVLGTAYLYDAATISQSALFAAIEAAAGSYDMSSKAISSATMATAGAVPATTFGYGATGTQYTMYFAILDGDNVYFSNEKTFTTTASETVANTVSFANQNNGTTTFSSTAATAGFAGAGHWSQAVPEPTSGLLMLLGLAGLALKRKRA